jgi:hypothetical protein
MIELAILRVLSSASQDNGGPLFGYATERPAKELISTVR